MQKFTKQERLCSKKIIDNLFRTGRYFETHLFKIFWDDTQLNSSYPVQIAISVGSKKVKKAVHRNKIKRQIREAWRKNKHLLYESLKKTGKQIAVFLLYWGENKMPYQTIESEIIVILKHFIYQTTNKNQNI